MRHLNFQVFSLILAPALIYSSCSKDQTTSKNSSSADQSISGRFLEDSMFQYDEKVEKLDQTSAANAIAKSEYFYFSAEKSTTTAATDKILRLTERCEIKFDEITVSEDKHAMNMGYIFDDADCLEVNDKYINQMKVQIFIQCSETDLSAYSSANGTHSVREYIYTVGSQDFCPNDKEQKTLINAEYKKIAENESARVIGGIMKANGSPCTTSFDGSTYKTSDCVFYQRTFKSTAESDTELTTKLSRFEGKDLEASSGARYFHKGKMNIRINNWDGTMNYTSSNVVPTYEIFNGTTQIKGSFKAGIFEVQ